MFKSKIDFWDVRSVSGSQQPLDLTYVNAENNITISTCSNYCFKMPFQDCSAKFLRANCRNKKQKSC